MTYSQDSTDFRFEKLKEIKKLYSKYNPVIHNTEEEIKYFFLCVNDFAIELKNPYTNKKEDSIDIWFEDTLDNNFSLDFLDWNKLYPCDENAYKDFLIDLNNLLENKMCILTAYEPRKMQKNQKRITYNKVLSICSNIQFSPDSVIEEIFKEFDSYKNKYPNIKKIKIFYWDLSLSFEVKK